MYTYIYMCVYDIFMHIYIYIYMRAKLCLYGVAEKALEQNGTKLFVLVFLII